MDGSIVVELTADCTTSQTVEKQQAAKPAGPPIEPDALWHTPDQEAWATIRGWHYPVLSDAFRQWLRGERHKRRLAIGKNKIAEAVDLFAAEAVIKGPEYRVYLRTARHKEAIFVDLADRR